MLIYPNGDKCSSGFQRMTIINFECNKNASKSDMFHFSLFFFYFRLVGTT